MENMKKMEMKDWVIWELKALYFAGCEKTCAATQKNVTSCFFGF